jgi:hypothetical protein
MDYTMVGGTVNLASRSEHERAGSSTCTTDHKITRADEGRTIATNGLLTAIAFMQAPTPGTYAYPDGLLSLVGDSNLNGSPRMLFHADVTTQRWTPHHPLHNYEIMQGATPFVACPDYAVTRFTSARPAAAPLGS